MKVEISTDKSCNTFSRALQHFKSFKNSRARHVRRRSLNQTAVIGSHQLRRLSGLLGRSWPDWWRWDVMFSLACGGGFKNGFGRWSWMVRHVVSFDVCWKCWCVSCQRMKTEVGVGKPWYWIILWLWKLLFFLCQKGPNWESSHSPIRNSVLAHRPADELRDVTDVLTFYCGSALAQLPQSHDHTATVVYHYSSLLSEAITQQQSTAPQYQDQQLAIIHAL